MLAMNKKVVASFIVLATILLLLLVFRVIRLPFLPIHPHQAMPNQTALFFEINIADIEQLTIAPSPIAQLFLPENLSQEVGLLREILGGGVDFPNHTECLISVNPTQHPAADLLFIIPKMGHLDVDEIGIAAGWSRRVYQYGNESLTTLKKAGNVCSFVVYRNLLIFARHAYLVEDALSQLKQPSSSLCTDKGFKKMNKRVPAEAGTFPVYIHFPSFQPQFAPMLNAVRFDQLKKVETIGEWALWNIPISGNPAVWKGAFVPSENNKMLMANKQANNPIDGKVWETVPDNLAGTLAMATGDALTTFFQDTALPIGNEAVFAIGETLENNQPEQFLLLAVTDTKLAEQAVQKIGPATMEKEYQLFNIWNIKNKGISSILGGQPTYAAVLSGFILFGNSLAGMERWLGKYLAGQTLSKDVAFLALKNELPKDAPLLLQVDGVKGWQQIAPFWNEKMIVSLGRNPIPFERMVGALEWKGPVGQMTFVQPEKPKAEQRFVNILWSVPLMANAALQPVVQMNQPKGELDIFITDDENRIYLVSRSGQLLWRRQLPERIQSDIFHVHLVNGDQGQFAFSTRSAIYVVDRAGEDVEGFPLELAVPATNGVTVVDFFQSNDYHFFIACENGKAYGFDEKGSPIEGWRPKEGIGWVEHPLLHFQAEGKDFLAMLDVTGKMKVFKKNGSDRFKTVVFDTPDLQRLDYQISKSSSRIVTSNREGKVYVTNLVDNHFGLQLRAGKNEEVKFLFADVIGDERKDYIALSGNELTVSHYEGNKFEKAFTHQYPWSQDEVFSVKWERRNKDFIGTVNRSKKQLFLMDGSGRIPDQFPLAGSTPFVIADLMGDGKPVVIAGNGAGVVAYVLE